MSAYNRSRLITAINKFNSGNFFECHEILEDIWFDVHDDSKLVYQGLLHYATALYHLTSSKKNIRGTLLQLDKALEKLSGYENFQGINILKLKFQIKRLKLKLIKKEAVKRLPKIILS